MKSIILMALIISLASFLLGCTGITGLPDYMDDDDIIFCPEVWDPVCGTDGQTYSNTCFASVAGVEVDYSGECDENLATQDESSTTTDETGDATVDETIDEEVDETVDEEVEDTDDETSDAMFCTEAQKQAEFCTIHYDPVCGDDGVSYGNSCEACSSGEVEYYIKGGC